MKSCKKETKLVLNVGWFLILALYSRVQRVLIGKVLNVHFLYLPNYIPSVIELARLSSIFNLYHND
jgi:hypothetical protein